jgi:hypothetical protein
MVVASIETNEGARITFLFILSVRLEERLATIRSTMLSYYNLWYPKDNALPELLLGETGIMRLHT